MVWRDIFHKKKSSYFVLVLYRLSNMLYILFLYITDIYFTFLGKKKTAEHAVAARELDCLSFREDGGLESMCYAICLDKSYLSSEYTPSLYCTAPVNLFSD